MTTTNATSAETAPSCGELLDAAWGVIANAGGPGGNWTTETPDWQEAAARWRENYHRWLDESRDHDSSAV